MVFGVQNPYQYNFDWDSYKHIWTSISEILRFETIGFCRLEDVFVRTCVVCVCVFFLAT